MYILIVGEQRYEIREDLAFIGRDPTCHIIISDDNEVSRKHACLIDVGSRVIAMDFKSSNGTLVNSVPVQHQELKPGDQVQVGSTVFTFDMPEQAGRIRHITSVGYKQHFQAEEYSIALRKAYEYVTSRTGRAALQYFTPMIEKMGKQADTSAIAKTCLDTGTTIAGADRGFVMLMQEDQGLQIVARTGIDAEYFLRRDLHYVLINEAIENQRVVIPKSNYIEKVFQQNTLVIPNVCSSVVVPLIYLSSPVGVMYADRRIASGPFSEDDIKALIFASYQAANVIGNLRLAMPPRQVEEILKILDTSLAGGEFIYCEVCGTPIDPRGKNPVVACGKCETLHHQDCWDYNNRCAIYGCMYTRMNPISATG